MKWKTDRPFLVFLYIHVAIVVAYVATGWTLIWLLYVNLGWFLVYVFWDIRSDHYLPSHLLVPVWKRVPVKWRWKIVGALNRSNRLCWPQLVDAAMNPTDEDDPCDGKLPLPGVDNRVKNCKFTCGWSLPGGEHTDHSDCTCYCGKFKIGGERA